MRLIGPRQSQLPSNDSVNTTRGRTQLAPSSKATQSVGGRHAPGGWLAGEAHTRSSTFGSVPVLVVGTW